MDNKLNGITEYHDWLKDLKLRVRQAQLKAAALVKCGTACGAISQQDEDPSAPQKLAQPVPESNSLGHNRVIISKCADVEEALYYVNKTSGITGAAVCRCIRLKADSF